MSKTKSNAKSLAKRRKSLDQKRNLTVRTGPMQLATQAMFTGGPDKAKQVLLDFKPFSALPIDALEFLSEICELERDRVNSFRCELAIADRLPSDSYRQHRAAVAAGNCGNYATSMLYAMRFLRLAPAEDVDEVAATFVAKVRKQASELVRREYGTDASIDNLELLEGMACVERTLMLFSEECYEEALSLIQGHLTKFPNDNRAMNNLSIALDMLGRTKEAVETLNKSLEVDPRNYFAVAKRCCMRFLIGETSLLDEDAETLIGLEPTRATDLGMSAEAFAIRGDDKHVLRLFDQLHANGWENNSPGVTSFIYHFAATVHCRQGHERKAVSLWKKAIEFNRDMNIASDNVQLLKKSDGVNETYYLPLAYWVPKRSWP